MAKTISAKELRDDMAAIVRRVRRGERYVVLYRSRPAFRLVPIGDEPDGNDDSPLREESLYRAQAVGASSDGLSSRDHDDVIYPNRRK